MCLIYLIYLIFLSKVIVPICPQIICFKSIQCSFHVGVQSMLLWETLKRITFSPSGIDNTTKTWEAVGVKARWGLAFVTLAQRSCFWLNILFWKQQVFNNACLVQTTEQQQQKVSLGSTLNHPDVFLLAVEHYLNTAASFGSGWRSNWRRLFLSSFSLISIINLQTVHATQTSGFTQKSLTTHQHVPVVI